MFKKLITAIFTCAFIIGGFSTSYAQTTTSATPSLANLLPADTAIFLELNTANETFLTDLLLTNLYEEFIYEESEDTQTLIQNIFENNLFALAISEIDPESSIDPVITASFQISDADFADFLELSENEDLVENEYEDITIYTEEPDKYLALLDNLFVITSSEESLHSIIDNFLSPENGAEALKTLANKSAYIKGKQKALNDNFLSAFIDLSFINELDTENMLLPAFDFNQAIIESIKSEFISIAQTKDGYNGSISVETDDAKLLEAGISTLEHNFIPSLYKNINGKDIIFYSESSGLKKTYEYLKKIISEPDAFEEMETTVNELIGLNMQKDILPVFDGQYSIAVHQGSGTLPSFTLIFDVSGFNRKAYLLMEALNAKLDSWIKEIEQETETEFHKLSSTKSGDTSFHKHTFDLVQSGFIPDADTFGIDKLNLHIGLSSDAKLIITTADKISNAFLETGTGLLSDKMFSESFNESNKQVTGIQYFNLDNLSNYLQSIAVLSDSEITPDQIGKIMGPWHSIYGYGTAEKGLATGTLDLQVSVDDLKNYADVFEELMLGTEDILDSFGDSKFELNDIEILGGTKVEFKDIDSDDWFFFYVEDLSEKGIISGYDDGTFLPNKPVTRAEFTKMTVEASRMAELFLDSAIVTDPSHFKDINGDEWYASYIAIGYNHGLVNGNPDGNFRPNAPITRAEAVQILYNISGEEYQNMADDEPFTDVQEWEWYWNAVSSAYNADIISGKDALNFAPAENLTRAEAAKIISNFLYSNLL